ncbi:MAG: 5-oxoprolinase subunit PxpA [Hyphomonas sp.]|nr:5-oxoprolinase subunit PxpA [Hyphomonas sp.]
MRRVICLNADLGELPGPAGRSLDAAMLSVVTRCNVACGGHAGDEASMRATVREAKAKAVEIGAHPSYPDVEHFGRRSLRMEPDDLAAAIEFQTRQLLLIASEEGADVRHLKAHGALYNDAVKDADLARLIVRVAMDAGIAQIIGPPGSALEAASGAAGCDFVAEGFADRTYEPDGSLTPRSIGGAVIENPASVLAQALLITAEGIVDVRGGGRIALPVRTLCLHSDTPGAPEHARNLRAGLEAAGIEVCA